MGRQIFISVLGTGFYSECCYEGAEFISRPTKFIQAAMVERYKQTIGWNPTDCVYILLTAAAKKFNWETTSREKFKGAETVHYVGLKNELEEFHPELQIIPADIPDGKNEEEIWQIFAVLYNLLQENDNVYIDITHSFRSLPMLLLVFCNYVKFMKNASIKAITYGNFEAKTDKGTAPIVDLFPLSELDDWTHAAATFTSTGSTSLLHKLTKERIVPILSNQELKRQNDAQWLNAKSVDKLVSSLSKIIHNLEFCRGSEIIKPDFITMLAKNLESVHTSAIPPLAPIIDKIKESILLFYSGEEATIFNMLQSAKWCYIHQRYQACVTLLQEGIITWLCMKYEKQSVLNGEERKLLSRLLQSISYRETNEDESLKKYENLKNLEHLEDIAKLFTDLTECRNDYNHAGMRINSASASRMQNIIGDLLNKIENLIGNENLSVQSGLSPKSDLLVNLSNHPSSQWKEAQLAAASEYGQITDLSFPTINPEDTEEDIYNLAQEYASKILQIKGDKFITVHVMGEQTFCLTLVSMLSSNNIPCVASTTKRNVIVNDDGSKTVMFDFVKFRKYSF